MTFSAESAGRRAAALTLLAALTLAGCKEIVHSRLSEAQANEVIAALGEAQIDAGKERIDDTSWQVQVRGDKLARALIVLRDRGLPSLQRPGMVEVFKKEGLISSPLEERARLHAALAEELAATLRRIDGIVDARVHVVIPHNDPLASRILPSSASVFIKHSPDLKMDVLAPSIKDLVTAGIEGLDVKNVSLFALPAQRSPMLAATAGKSASWTSGLSVPAPVGVAAAATLSTPAASNDSGSSHLLALLGSLVFGAIFVGALVLWNEYRRDRRFLLPQATGRSRFWRIAGRWLRMRDGGIRGR